MSTSTNLESSSQSFGHDAVDPSAKSPIITVEKTEEGKVIGDMMSKYLEANAGQISGLSGDEASDFGEILDDEVVGDDEEDEGTVEGVPDGPLLGPLIPNVKPNRLSPPPPQEHHQHKPRGSSSMRQKMDQMIEMMKQSKAREEALSQQVFELKEAVNRLERLLLSQHVNADTK